MAKDYSIFTGTKPGNDYSIYTGTPPTAKAKPLPDQTLTGDMTQKDNAAKLKKKKKPKKKYPNPLEMTFEDEFREMKERLGMREGSTQAERNIMIAKIKKANS